MNIIITMIGSLIIKGISAIIEILTQILITNKSGISGFGNYVFYVSILEFSYFCFFSGNAKINTYYVSNDKDIREFKKKYNKYYLFPTILVFIIISKLINNFYMFIVSISLVFYYFAFDNTSLELSKGEINISLVSEYLIGRIVMLLGGILLSLTNSLTGVNLLILYGIQYLIIIIVIKYKSKNIQNVEKVKVDIKKAIRFQESDIAAGLISYSPTIIQYIIGGAVSAGFIGIISIIKKIVNFISGPTAKVFLPEFAKLIEKNNINGLVDTYRVIVRIQMIFVSFIAVPLICFPDILLNLFNSSLIEYRNAFSITASSLLFIASVGPVTGLLQMGGREKVSNINQWISIIIMIFVWYIFRKNYLFSIYGICIQALSEGVLKYISATKLLKRNPVKITEYIMSWLPIIVIKIFVEKLNLQKSFVALIICLIFVSVINILIAYNDNSIRKNLEEILRKEK